MFEQISRLEGAVEWRSPPETPLTDPSLPAAQEVDKTQTRSEVRINIHNMAVI